MQLNIYGILLKVLKFRTETNQVMSDAVHVEVP